MNDVMLDFETFGNGKNKCLSQVGAIYFNNTTGELGQAFKANIDARTHVALGAQIDAETVYWWLQQSNEARASVATGELRDVKSVLTELNEFLRPAKRIWSHATFDFVTLQESLKQCGIKPSFRYSVGLDLRTLTYLGGVKVDKVERTGVHHDALEDCKHQVKYCVQSLNAVKTAKILIRFANGLLE